MSSQLFNIMQRRGGQFQRVAQRGGRLSEGRFMAAAARAVAPASRERHVLTPQLGDSARGKSRACRDRRVKQRARSRGCTRHSRGRRSEAGLRSNGAELGEV